MKYLKAFFIILSLSTSTFSQQFSGVDYIIQNAISSHITPGASIIIGSDSTILYHKAYGKFTYRSSSTVVDTSHMFDQASCTKVFATTSCIMYLVDSGLVNIEEYVATYIPAFAQNGKGSVKIKHLLLHSSGLKAYYSPSSGQTPQQIINAIYALPLQNPIGTYLYSCLNFVTLMKVVEAVTGTPMYQYYKTNITDTLQMNSTMFSPSAPLYSQCLPTSSVSGYQGIVHDPLARGLDGYSGNAGLFSTTGDLAKICIALLNGGEYRNIRIFNESTVTQFTTRYNPTGSTRALGWGTNASGNTSAGTLLSLEAFGHTGYTGTSVWIDPVRKIFIVFLTNRVYPDDSASITSTRKSVHDAVVRAIEGTPPQPTLNSIQLNSTNDLEFSWNPNIVMGPVDSTEIFIDTGSGFSLYSQLTTDSNSIFISSGQFPLDTMIRVKMKNKYNSNSSVESDIYCIKGWKKDLLIVDGYDRVGSWGLPNHYFCQVHANALPDSIHYESCDNDQVISEQINLNDYKYVLWILADESTSDETFSDAEKPIVINYFQQGGCLFVSGSEIGWDLGRSSSSTSDRNFYNNFLRANYLGDDSGNYSVNGQSGTPFSGLSFQYGTGSALYIEDYPDYIAAINSGVVALKYGNSQNAGLFYEGKYQNTGEYGKLVYLAFPFETIIGSNNRKSLMESVIQFFQSPISSIASVNNNLPKNFILKQNYPNPFNPTTTIEFSTPKLEFVTLKIYNPLGQEVATLVSENLIAGKYEYVWDASSLPSGAYFCELKAGDYSKTQKMILLK